MDSSQLDVTQLQGYIEKMLKFILNHSVNRLPIKQSDLIQKCMESKNRLFPRVFSTVKQYLNEIYGITIIEVEGVKPTKFICISQIPGCSSLEYKEDERKNIGLLFIILSYIYMKGGTVSESTITHFLKKFGIESNAPHEYFGSVHKLIEETFVKQLYLCREKQTQEGSKDEKISYSWGFRATKEFQKKDVLDTVAKLHDKPTICFKKQYIEIYGSLNQAVDDQADTEAEAETVTSTPHTSEISQRRRKAKRST